MNQFVSSPEIMSRDDTALLVVDVQEKLIRLIRGHQRLVWNIRRLLDAAKVFAIPVLATEQYPQGLGGTVEELRNRLGAIPGKTTFSSCGCSELADSLAATGRRRVLVAGIEAHVCVAQTVFDLVANGYWVAVAADAIGARFEVDYQFALRRMEMAGAVLTTTEAAMFEWCGRSGTDEFKKISALVRESGPSE